MEQNNNKLNHRFDYLLLLFVALGVLIVALEVGKNLISEINSGKENLSIQQSIVNSPISKKDKQKSYEEWLKRTSGGREVKDKQP